MNVEPGLIFAALTALVAAIGWLFRVEARTHNNKGAVEALQRVVIDNKRETESALLAQKVVADLEAKGARETRELLIRMEEQLKHLTSLVESWKEAPTRRKPAQ